MPEWDVQCSSSGLRRNRGDLSQPECMPLLQDTDTEPWHDAGVQISHAVTGIHGQCLHCGGTLLSHLCCHGSAALWRPLLDLQRYLCCQQGMHQHTACLPVMTMAPKAVPFLYDSFAAACMYTRAEIMPVATCKL